MPTGYCDVPGCCTDDGKWHENVSRLYPVPSVPINGFGARTVRKSLTDSAARKLRRRTKWLNACRFYFPCVSKTKKLFVCSKHFVSGKPAPQKDEDSVDWVPTLRLPQLSTNTTASAADDLSYEGNDIDSVGLEDGETSGDSGCSGEESESEENEGECWKEKFQRLQEKFVHLEDKNERLEDKCDNLDEKIASLEEEVQKLLVALSRTTTLNEDYFRGDDKKVRYLTGFPSYPLMMVMFRQVEPYVKQSSRSALAKFEKFVVTCMRLRLNVEFRMLAHYFNVSENTASRAFYELIPIMSVRFGPLVFWPEREKLYESMPVIFRESFGRKVAVIIDCFEVTMERPGNILAAAQVYSQYKKSPTVKFLIAISPQGAISFVSIGYGGRSSDKFITEHSGFLDKLKPGDIILADRGFTIHELVRMQRAEIHMPAFKGRGVPQMDPYKIEESRKVSNLRIHVERVIGYLRGHFKILSCKLPTEFFHGDHEIPIIDQIICIACAITNLYGNVVPEL